MKLTTLVARVSMCALVAATALAQTPPLVVQDAWIRAAPGSDVAAAYLSLRNSTAKPITITSVYSPVASHSMIHETSVLAGQSRMRPHERLTVPAGQTVKLEPGGLHVMLQGLSRPLTVGEKVPLVLALAGGSTVQLTATVRPLNAE
ncbi:MAG TPA: copper chaperone PCu(A)C [Steroidobacteraceae bacterium]